MSTVVRLTTNMNGVDITDRDRRMVQAAASYGLVARKQFQHAESWPCTSDVNRRLKKLTDARVLSRRFQPVTEGSAPALYFLGPVGIQLLAEGNEIETQKLGRVRRYFATIDPRFLAHTLATTDFGVEFTLSLKAHKGRVLDWQNERTLVDQCSRPEDATDMALRPDAYISYQVGQLTFNAFIEMDMGTESYHRIRKKIDLYKTFRYSGLMKSNFDRDFFRLLIVTSSEGRTLKIQRLVSEDPGFKIFVAKSEDINKTLLTSRSWFRPGTSTPVALHIESELLGKVS